MLCLKGTQTMWSKENQAMMGNGRRKAQKPKTTSKTLELGVNDGHTDYLHVNTFTWTKISIA